MTAWLYWDKIIKDLGLLERLLPYCCSLGLLIWIIVGVSYEVHIRENCIDMVCSGALSTCGLSGTSPPILIVEESRSLCSVL